MSKYGAVGSNQRVMSQMFRHLVRHPKPFHHMTLKAISRHDMRAGDRVEIHTPRKSYYISGDEELHMVSDDTRKHTLDNSVRIVVRGEKPEEILSRIGDRLALKVRAPRRRVEKEKVIEFIHQVSRNPRVYTESFVHSQLDMWGSRALKYMEKKAIGIPGSQLYDYAAYMRRYLEQSAAGVDTSSVMRFGRRKLANWSAIGYNGWPLRGRIPSNIEIHVLSGMELIADWRKKEFVELLVDGLRNCGIMVTTPSWPGGKFVWDHGKNTWIEKKEDYEGIADITYFDPVGFRAKAKKRISRDSFTMILRAASALIGHRANVMSLKSTPPSWWRLRQSPLSAMAGTAYISELHLVDMWDYERAVRFISPLEWMRVQNSMITRMRFGGAKFRKNAVWGVIAEGSDMRHARVVLKGIERKLREYGEKVSGPPGGPQI